MTVAAVLAEHPHVVVNVTTENRDGKPARLFVQLKPGISRPDWVALKCDLYKCRENGDFDYWAEGPVLGMPLVIQTKEPK